MNHGMSRERYYYDQVGVNSRLDTLQAAILRIKLGHLDSYRSARQEVAAYYDRELGSIEGVETPKRSPFSTHVFHQYTLKVNADKRDGLKQWLTAKQIPSAIYYPVPLHLQNAYRDLGYDNGDLPVSESLSTRVLSLPIHTEMEEEQLDYICQQIKAYFKQ